MKYEEARSQLEKAIKEQKSIRTPKLSKILQAMNVSLKSKLEGHDPKVEYLKGELKKARRN